MMTPITHCPTCGTPRLRRVTRAVTGLTPQGRYQARGVTFYLCDNCGEKLYDRGAMEKIAAARRASSITRTTPAKPRPRRQKARV